MGASPCHRAQGQFDFLALRDGGPLEHLADAGGGLTAGDALHGLVQPVEEASLDLVGEPAAIRRAARTLLGEDALRSLAVANMGGEDFAFFTERMEGCFMRIGTLGEGRSTAGVHTPRFDPDEDALLIASVLLAECARTASAALRT